MLGRNGTGATLIKFFDLYHIANWNSRLSLRQLSINLWHVLRIGAFFQKLNVDYRFTTFHVMASCEGDPDNGVTEKNSNPKEKTKRVGHLNQSQYDEMIQMKKNRIEFITRYKAGKNYDQGELDRIIKREKKYLLDDEGVLHKIVLARGKKESRQVIEPNKCTAFIKKIHLRLAHMGYKRLHAFVSIFIFIFTLTTLFNYHNQKRYAKHTPMSPRSSVTISLRTV